jgi:hypothetical protein
MRGKRAFTEVKKSMFTEIVMNAYWHGFSDGQNVEMSKPRPDYLRNIYWEGRRKEILEIALCAIEKIYI